MRTDSDDERALLDSETRRPSGSWKCLVCLGLTLSACGAEPSGARDSTPPGPPGPEIDQAVAAVLSTTCTVSSSGIAIALNAGDLAVIALNPANGKVTLNANQPNGSPCEAATTLPVRVTAGTSGIHGVYLDLSSGLFSTATASNNPKIQLNFGTGSNDTLTVHGSAGADHLYFGRGTVTGTYLLNLNGGTNTGDDSLVDVSIIGAERVVVDGSGGDDIIDGSGLFGTTAPYPNALNLSGGSGNDLITGGAGDDVLSGDAGNDRLNGGKGHNRYLSGAANDGIDVIASEATAVDTADYSQRTSALSLYLDNAAHSGEAGENDTLPPGISVLLGGSGNDTLSAVGSTFNHSLMGGPGNDTLIGGAGLDTLFGGDGVLQQDGDDVFVGSKATVSYQNRTQPITVTVNAAGVGGADANDGDPALPEKDEVRCPNVLGSITAANTLTGDANSNALTGGNGADTLVGGAGSDALSGGAGNDALYGGAGDDTLLGGPGGDALYGGDGDDVLEGDAHSDRFDCDGKNDVSSAGSAPGNADFTVDYQPGAPDSDTRVTPSNCEF